MARMGDRRDAYRVLAEKPERRKPLGRPRRRWEDNIKMDFQQVEWGHGIASSGSEMGQVAGSCECGKETSGSIRCGEFLGQLRDCYLLKKDLCPGITVL